MENLFLEINVAWDKPVDITYVKKHDSCFEPVKDCPFIDYVINWFVCLVYVDMGFLKDHIQIF